MEGQQPVRNIGPMNCNTGAIETFMFQEKIEENSKHLNK
jgi:fructose-specific phosphotransferase system component IIB